MKLFRNLWTWVVLAFVLLIGGWITLGYLAFSNTPESVEIIQNSEN